MTVCHGMSLWCPRGSLSVACVGLCDALLFLRGWVHLCWGPACLCVLSAARHPCVFVYDVYVSPSADGCPPLYVMCLSVRVSARCVCHVWAACACLTSASWRGAHVFMVVYRSSVPARHRGPCTLSRVCWSLSVPPPPLPPGSQCYWGASCHDYAPSSLHPPSSHPSSDRLSAPPIPAALGGGALTLPPPSYPSPPHPSNPGSPAPLLCPPLHPFICLSLQRGGGGYLSQ